MSLDVYLYGPEQEIECVCECGHMHTRKHRECYYSANITHNLWKMADNAGIYTACWRPEEIGITKASQLVPILKAGIDLMESDPARFESFDSPNGWGLYEHFVPWLKNYLQACEEYPEAEVNVLR